ncbi:peptide-methionine (S)-S-oxide reductase MsrA [Cognatiluteimonas profundi]|uniref:peptide-methionine (S)-S-oxide reductase MsrA n=1 Tax=Cognatiluteimonas profundi TaxID=2594501 RepID=UPI00131D6F0A|nr:peptide-methionine (S)-S-oxide reductase MsrA [Lysobacter profundi]
MRKPSLRAGKSILATALLAGLMACSAGFARSKPVALPDPTLDLPSTAAAGEQTAVFAGGCFWGVEAVFEHVKGVRQATSGYSGGNSGSAEYDTVSTGRTGHAESVKVVYDPSKVSYGQLLKVYFSVAHDPTQLNRQSPDVGTQYRSEIFTTSDAQQKVARAYIAQLTAARVFPAPIVTRVEPLKAFYPAEAYHQDYLKLHPNDPYIVYNDAPKLVHLKQLFPTLYKGG